MDKVLFVCQANIGRSQAAMEFYNLLVPGHGASAGTIVDNPGQKLKDRLGAIPIVAVMKEHGVDVADNQRTQLDETMISKFDKIVVMAELKTVPDWLLNNPKTIIWPVEDLKGKTPEQTRVIVTQIKDKVEELVKNSNLTNSWFNQFLYYNFTLMTRKARLVQEFMAPNDKGVASRINDFYHEIGWLVGLHEAGKSIRVAPEVDAEVLPMIAYWLTDTDRKSNRFVVYAAAKPEPSNYSLA